MEVRFLKFVTKLSNFINQVRLLSRISANILFLNSFERLVQRDFSPKGASEMNVQRYARVAGILFLISLVAGGGEGRVRARPHPHRPGATDERRRSRRAAHGDPWADREAVGHPGTARP